MVGSFIVRKHWIFSLGLLGVLGAAAFAVDTHASRKLDPTVCEGCEAEAAAYAYALIEYEAAQEALQEAEDAYINCAEQGDGGDDGGEDRFAGKSVLVK